MPKDAQGGDWLTRHLPGIFQGLMAAALGGGLLPGVQIGWERFLHRPIASWAEGPLASGIAAFVLVPTIWVVSRPLSRLAAHRVLGKTPEIKGDRLSIYVAHFGDDEQSATARNRVIASIRAELGPERVEVLPAGILLRLTEGVSDDIAANDATKKARALLKKKHGDLLIWGRVVAMPEMKPQLDLRFVSAESDRSRTEPFGFTDKLMLEPDFGPEMGAALVAVPSALAAPALRDAGIYLVQTLMPVANRLARLTRNIPASMRADDRALLLHSYGLIQFVIGAQSGESMPLEEAVAAFREALKEWTRKRVPLDWAATQNSLGNALASLGERESGMERQEEAVAAYSAALEVLTGDTAPRYQTIAQLGLKRATKLLEERKRALH